MHIQFVVQYVHFILQLSHFSSLSSFKRKSLKRRRCLTVSATHRQEEENINPCKLLSRNLCRAQDTLKRGLFGYLIVVGWGDSRLDPPEQPLDCSRVTQVPHERFYQRESRFPTYRRLKKEVINDVTLCRKGCQSGSNFFRGSSDGNNPPPPLNTIRWGKACLKRQVSTCLDKDSTENTSPFREEMQRTRSKMLAKHHVRLPGLFFHSQNQRFCVLVKGRVSSCRLRSISGVKNLCCF